MSWRLYCGPASPLWADALVTADNVHEISVEWLGWGPMRVYTESLDNAVFRALRDAWDDLCWDDYRVIVAQE